MKKKIIPAAPFKNFQDIEILTNKVGQKLNRIQIDVCDGRFVDSISWPFTEYSQDSFSKLKDKIDLDVYLPKWEDINYSVDLMVQNPEKYLETFIAYGVDECVIHFRSVETEEAWQKIFDVCERFELNLGIAIDLKTEVSLFENFIKRNKNKIRFVQVMGIEKIGFQGQILSKKSMNLVRDLRVEFGDMQIYFDGGINDITIQEIAESGVDVFCVGSYLTKAFDFSDNLSILKNILKEFS